MVKTTKLAFYFYFFGKTKIRVMSPFSDEKIQLARLMERNGYSEQDAASRIHSQMPLSTKCERSDFVIENSASLDETRIQVEKVIAYFQSSNHHIYNRLYLGICVAISFSLLTLFAFLAWKLLFI